MRASAAFRNVAVAEERIMRRVAKAGKLLALILLALAAPSMSRAQASGATANGITPVQKCADLVNLKIPSSTVVIAKAEEIPTAPAGTVRASAVSPEMIPVAIPSHCRAEGKIDPRTGLD